MTVHVKRWESGDWFEVLIDGKVKVRGHSVYYEELLRALGIPFTEEDVPDEEG
jgi:hypothetical protein